MPFCNNRELMSYEEAMRLLREHNTCAYNFPECLTECEICKDQPTFFHNYCKKCKEMRQYETVWEIRQIWKEDIKEQMKKFE